MLRTEQKNLTQINHRNVFIQTQTLCANIICSSIAGDNGGKAEGERKFVAFFVKMRMTGKPKNEPKMSTN